MENFTNETIDTNQLPKFEEVTFTKLDPKFIWVVLINLAFFIGLLILVPILFSMFKSEIFSERVWLIIGAVIPVFSILLVVFSFIGFQRKGFAFREHDVLYKY